MNERTRTGLEILLTAFLVGLLGNVLLRQTPWGVNAFLFVAVFTAAMIFITVRHRPELLTVRTLSLQGAMIFFASMFVVRDSIELRVYDTFAIIILMGILVLPNFGINQRIAGVFHYAVGFLWSGLTSLFGPFILLGADIDWKAMPGNRLSRIVFSVLRGLAVALPLVLVFGALFMAADAAFEDFANRVVNFDIEIVISHVLLTSALAWLVAGYFRGSLVDHFAAAAASAAQPAEASPIPKPGAEPKQEAKASETGFVQNLSTDPVTEPGPLPDNATVLEHINRPDWNAGIPACNESEARKEEDLSGNVEAEITPAGDGVVLSSPEPKKRDWQNWDNTRFPQAFTLGTVETVIILGLVNILFLSFVIFQLPYLFGGMELVQNTPDLKLADFARRGFGELVVVAFLVLPILLASHWLLRRDNARNETIFRIFAGVQVALLFVIMASAVQRIVLLTGPLGYGWTTVRFYPLMVITWLAAVFAWFGWTVLRGRRNNFAWGALWAAIIVLGGTNLMNPDDFIARKNIQLMQQGREFDTRYNVKELSSDAFPALIRSLPELSHDDQCRIAHSLSRWKDNYGSDLRSWNMARSNAQQDIVLLRSGFNLDQCSVDINWNWY